MWKYLTAADVEGLHERVINSHELQGRAKDKSLEGALSRIDYRIQYGVIQDVYDLAATYAVVIAQGHVFNDANKRTAYIAMHTCLKLNEVDLTFHDTKIADVIIKVAQGHMDEGELATWLRRKQISEQ